MYVPGMDFGIIVKCLILDCRVETVAMESSILADFGAVIPFLSFFLAL